MKKNQLAVQLYTLRNHLTTPRDIASSFHRIKASGYDAVELAGLGKVEPKELKAMLDGEGLFCCSSHEMRVLHDPGEVADRLSFLSVPIAVYPYPEGIDFGTEASVYSFVDLLGRTGERLVRSGIRFAYHNHHIEFRRSGQRIILDTIYEESDPSFVSAELDTYWIQAGGGDPASWCAKMKGRLPLLHLKDYGIDETNNPVFREIGGGNLDFGGIISAAEESGCRWFIVEQDSGWIGGDPFASLERSRTYIANSLCV